MSDAVPPLASLPGTYRLIEDATLTMTIEDWSGVRYPTRAARRRRKHRQNIVLRHVPRPEFFIFGQTIVAHPEMMRKLLAAVPERVHGA